MITPSWCVQIDPYTVYSLWYRSRVVLILELLVTRYNHRQVYLKSYAKFFFLNVGQTRVLRYIHPIPLGQTNEDLVVPAAWATCMPVTPDAVVHGTEADALLVRPRISHTRNGYRLLSRP